MKGSDGLGVILGIGGSQVGESLGVFFKKINIERRNGQGQIGKSKRVGGKFQGRSGVFFQKVDGRKFGRGNRETAKIYRLIGVELIAFEKVLIGFDILILIILPVALSQSDVGKIEFKKMRR